MNQRAQELHLAVSARSRRSAAWPSAGTRSTTGI